MKLHEDAFVYETKCMNIGELLRYWIIHLFPNCMVHAFSIITIRHSKFNHATKSNVELEAYLLVWHCDERSSEVELCICVPVYGKDT